jgi:hypothetical protein
MSAYHADPNVVPIRVQPVGTRDARHWAAHRQSTVPVLYSDFFRDAPSDVVAR